MKKLLLSVIGLTMLTFSAASQSDVLLIEAISQEPANSAAGLPRPAKYTSMSKVREKYGDPVQEHPWVGDPPISRWDYQGYSVYFENEYVINTVVHR